MAVHRTVLLFAVISLATSVSAQCPRLSGACMCVPSIYEPVSIVCDNAGSLPNVLQSIQPAANLLINSLSITNTPIPRLDANNFQGLTINRLVLNRNGLSDIDASAFDGELLDSLLELDLKDNVLGQIPQNGVPKLRNLRKLYLNKNRIAQLQQNAFADYQSKDSLLKLDLSSNKLTDIGLGGPAVFRPLSNLEELSLETNSLTTIPSSALQQQRNTLKDLNLGLNQINNVPLGALNFANLESLSLEFNGISSINGEAFRGVPKLLYLYVTGNKFPSWDPEMFRNVPQLKILGIGETPIRTIPSNALENIPQLVRLEMSESAVDNIESGAFQLTPQLQALIMNKNRLSRIRRDMFNGLNELYTLDLQGNQLEFVEDRSWSDLAGLRHLDISNNNLETLQNFTFDNTFLPVGDTRMLYLCGNPWACDRRLEWFRNYLRANRDIQIDKPGCMSVCRTGPVVDCPLRQFCEPGAPTQAPITGTALSMVGWIILAVILAILLTSIVLLALVRYFVSKKRKSDKEQEIEEERIVSSAASGYHPATVGGASVVGYPASAVDLDLPPAHTLDDRPNYWVY